MTRSHCPECGEPYRSHWFEAMQGQCFTCEYEHAARTWRLSPAANYSSRQPGAEAGRSPRVENMLTRNDRRNAR